ncbi:polyketide cyclase [Elizabethkingia anophelis]|uniref:Polyketide cyclase n=1 Tax=Elizabethkingia anophelis R26 TaxID=1246994 RepID=A0ABM6MPA4_9FLAO|nr:polyketide cyclase [Elizabethkingia anophelis]ATC34856.1 polyketide cyclase [Elizabethkingia anophelis R26]ATC38498.1 polyketide cyclase [Elizabethkingia anophelis Ag1]ATC42178.1 polyketide cyclase [Elizabethkingia anophelis]ATC45854.1 polyketide cyclase [Elizabethkingia anophelis]ELR78494.1 polyketide cyclase/dehydrase [Elizabethkingia anophelis R26]
MKWVKLIITFLVLIFGIYAVSMIFVEKTKSFSVKKEINFPLEKVFPQFNNLYNFSQWNEFIQENDHLGFSYYTPYDGVGSSMHFVNKRDSAENGDVFIRYVIPNRGIKYQLFKNTDSNPYLIDVSFKKLGAEKTEVTWYVRTPARPFLKRSLNLIYEENFVSGIDKSIAALANHLGNKVDREAKLNTIKYDTIVEENHEEAILLGLNVSASNRKKGDFFNSVVMNYNKLYSFMTKDLGKKNDEFGEPQLVMRSNNVNDKEISYFYGATVSKKFDVTDNNFNFRDVKASKTLVAYYKGNYEGRKKAIANLVAEAKKREMSVGELTEVFVEPPIENQDVILKIALQIY